MVAKIKEIHPIDLLYQPYQRLDKYELAELLGVSYNTICKWAEKKRNPSTPVRKLAYLILQDMRLQHPKAA